MPSTTHKQVWSRTTALARIAELENQIRTTALERELTVYAPSLLLALRKAADDSVILRSHLIKAGAILPPTLRDIWQAGLK